MAPVSPLETLRRYAPGRDWGGDAAGRDWGGDGDRHGHGQGDGRRGERGQLLLIGGLLLAITLVSLTLILNSGIYTHNLATRSGSAADEALAHRSGVESGVGDLVEVAIDDHPDDLDGQTATITDALPAIREQVGRAVARDSTYANVTYVGQTNGTRIVQSTDRNFTNASGASDWELVANAAGIRRFRLDVDRSDLVSTDKSSVDGTDAFRVRLVDDDGNEWLVYVYEAGGETKVVTENATTSTKYGPCSDADGTTTRITVTAGTVAGDRCPALEFFDRLGNDLDPTSGLTVQYNSTETSDSPTVSGTYELTANRSESAVDDGDFQSDASGDFPNAREAVYSVEVEFVYETSDLTYETLIAVVPGEPRD